MSVKHDDKTVTEELYGEEKLWLFLNISVTSH
jgi:hypothetical protein